jgi:zinc transport system substrate-binding protein
MLKQILILLLSLSAIACQRGGKPAGNDSEAKKPLVLVSIPPYVKMVEEIAGDTVQILSITDATSDPHIFEPKPKATEMYKGAKLWIGVGEPFEKKLLERLKSIDSDIEFVDLTTKIPLLHFNQEIPQKDLCKDCKHQKDRHIWLSPNSILQQTPIIATYLATLQPKEKEIYAKNLYALDLKIRHLNGTFQKQLAPYHNTAILVSHPAFGYFCHQYGIIQLAISSDEQEQVKPKDLAKVCKYMEEYDVRAIVIEPNHDVKSIRSICNGKDLPYKKINSIAPDYMKSMQELADLISGAPDDSP